ncbi:MAG: response regulator transcription factor [Lachnospiraceae bacterium]|nr:response regulator transcription factor [Lachnospiraceae bacterium]
MKKIGILEDDIKLGSELKYFLETNGYEGRYISPDEYAGMDEAKLIDTVIGEDLDLLLLDIGLPGINGVHLCKNFRKKSSVPIIMITGDDSEMTELMSITNGADDFVPKPFNTQILLARMERILERLKRDDKADDVTEIKLESGAIMSAMLPKGKITGPEGSLELSKNEIQILKILTDNKGEVVTREEIMNLLWDNQSFVDDNTLTVNMTRLKGKLEEIGIKDAIVTKRGMGYLFR